MRIQQLHRTHPDVFIFDFRRLVRIPICTLVFLTISTNLFVPQRGAGDGERETMLLRGNGNRETGTASEVRRAVAIAT